MQVKHAFALSGALPATASKLDGLAPGKGPMRGRVGLLDGFSFGIGLVCDTLLLCLLAWLSVYTSL